MNLTRRLLIISVICFTHSVNADLRTIAGLSEVQLSLAKSIHDICPKLADKTDKTTNETNLFFACRAMIQTSNDIQGEGTSTYSLGLSENDLIEALDTIAHEESATTGSVFTKHPQNLNATIGNRINQIRTINLRTYTGNIKINNQQLPLIIFNADENKKSIASALSFYTNGSYNSGGKKSSTREDSYDYFSSSILAGADLRLNNYSFFGAALSYSYTSADITSDSYKNLTETQGFGSVLYATFHSRDSYLSFTINSNSQNIDSKRYVPSIDFQNSSITGAQALKASSAAKTSGFGVSAGHDNSFGSINFSHYGKLSFQQIYVDAYNENSANPLALHIDDDKISSFRSTVGMNLSHIGSYSFGVLTEFLKIEWIHEFENQSRNINASYLYDPFDNPSVFSAPTEEPDRDFFLVSIGLTTVLPMGTQAFFSYENTSGMNRITNHSFVLGARWETL